MRYPLPLFLFLVLLMSVSSCKDKAEAHDHEHNHDHEHHVQVYSKDIPQDFLKFYLSFLSDTSFQKAHIVFPLKTQADGTPWLAENWNCHKPFSDDGNFLQEFLNLNGLIIETISDPKGMYKMERRYMRAADSYNLIYFTVMNAFENSEDWESQPSGN